MGRRPLILNMDETSVVRHVSGLRGTIVRQRSRGQDAKDHASLGERRSYVSFLACVTHDMSVQAKLPQVLLGNEHQFTREVLRSTALSSLPPSVALWRQKSAWNSHATMRKWLTLLAKSLRDLVHERYVIVLLDVHPSHFDSTIFQHARRCGLRLIDVPAKMTAFLQPCDTHVFAKFKFAYRKAWQEEKSRAPGGHVSTVCWLQLVCGVVQKIVSQGNWQKAFLATGILESQQQMSSQLLSDLGFHAAAAAPSGAPSEQAAACIFPRCSKKLDIISYILWQPKSHRSKAALGQDSQPAEASSSSSAVPSQKRRVLPATFQAKVIRRLE